MSTEKERLEKAMQRIKSILQEEDLAATVVLTTPDTNANEDDFVTIKYDHVDTSFSYAKTFKHHCCDKHGKVDGIMIHAELSKEATPDIAAKKLKQTVGMFMALHKGVKRTQKMCEEVVGSIGEILVKELVKRNKPEEATYFMKKTNMN